MNDPIPAKSVERLFPFVLKSRNLLVGRDTLRRSKSKLHFILITTDISDGSRAEILSDFTHYPVVQKYTSEELEKFFGIKGAKVVGFAKSGLAQSIYGELKEQRINKPVTPTKLKTETDAPTEQKKIAQGCEARATLGKRPTK